VDLGPRVRGLLHQVVLEHKKSSFLSIAEKRGNFSTIMLRRRDRPMPMPDPTMEREMRELHARLDAMRQHRGATVDNGDISKANSENEAGHEGEEVTV
jgi:hypothetical protein